MYTPGPSARAFRGRLLRWYARHRRDLAWRRTRDPYRILVSEVMLQQTQARRVVPAYRGFLRRFPSLRALARASLGQVLVEWSGLGYPRRARDLHRIAQRSGGGRFPTDVAALDALPGVGAYTAAAVACFSTGAPVAFADTNIRRVLGRVLLGRTASEREAVGIDAALMPRDAARWHHALMDLGATICVARAPRCGDCPVYDACLAKGVDATPAVRRQPEFATSDRRIRGAIMKLLVERRSLPVRSLRRALPDPRVPRLVADLAREGLVATRNDRVGLPRG